MIRLFLTDGHSPTREALRKDMEAAGVGVVGDAGTGEELLAQLTNAAPTVVLLDLSLPGPDVFALLPALREQYPQLRVLVRGELTNEHYVARSFDLGAHGYVLKNIMPAELVYGLSTVAAGRQFLCSAIGVALLGRLFVSNPGASDAARAALGLSKREIEVLGLVAQGMTNAEIATKLFTSKRTIETHRQNIIAKTQAKNTAALIKLAARQGLLPE
ncbi:LuxR C-terminal-related transcriptional regulator [Hymenobacter arizonensis]|uniref:DNA-binding response regulator, NarL/FixJ family, contains REC and HTH domains n=1 Tax=Hymenobacter arizonensis TaxID=1227077 RepID=A0A1I6AGC9_HYMAR|nr:response regulator transcription factor [Hymenobacter arizonensis]SFQ67715.1 DNA-binding response regulator, NarL/FixJ family, contains REC and HTH domains [Hymenobacter arizonensis]